MDTIDRKSLIGRFNRTCRRALDAAAGLTLSRQQYNVEIEHLLLVLSDSTDNDAAAILRHFEIDPGRLAADLTRALDSMLSGNGRNPDISPDITELAKLAWLFASLETQSSKIRSGHMLWALVADDGLGRRARDMSPHLARLNPEALRRDFASITHGSVEAAGAEAAPASAAGDRSGGAATPVAGEQPTLDKYTIDLTAQARDGRIDPVLGRDAEIRQVVDILTRRRQNNPILTGEAGVGKTAVVEGLALRIAAGDVPRALQGAVLRTLDLGLLQAGAGVRGEFENRLKSVIEEVKSSPRSVILFIDEAHTMIGAGGAQGQNDAANLLKPALARGELRTVAATTWAEYKKYFEKDAALSRRFQVVKVDEPSEPIAVAMIRGLVDALERHHNVRILDEAVAEAVRLSARFIPARHLPDKAVSVIDTACARVAMSQAAVPPMIEDRRRRIGIVDTELRIIDREMSAGADHAERQAALVDERAAAEQELAALVQRWNEEKLLVAEMATLRRTIEEAPGGAGGSVARRQLASASERLRAIQGEQPLIFPVVDGQAVAEIVQSWTGIPTGRMHADEIRSVLGLRAAMEQRIVGQPHALEVVAQAIRVSRAGLTDPRKPIGVFLMAGTSGVGKTETALSLADTLYGGEQNLTVINMTEFKEEHKVSLLMGSPPGYVGYGEGGILTEAVRRKPYSVVLLDEIEKAHPGVQDVFYQVFDKGTMKDGEGRDIDFRNTVIMMTSNAGTELIEKLNADPATAPDAAGLAQALRPELLKYFKPAFLGRVTLVPYLPLSDEILRQIVALQLGRIRTRISATYRAEFVWEPAVVEAIAARCTESGSGARNVENILMKSLLPDVSAALLARLAEGASIQSVTMGLETAGTFCYSIH